MPSPRLGVPAQDRQRGEPARGTERRSMTALLGLAVLLGVLATMLALGLAISWFAVPMSRLLRWVVPGVVGSLIVLGIVLLSGRNPFARLGAVSTR